MINTTDFIATTTRTASVHSGHPFVVEAGIAYGGNLRKDQRTNILRFANRVPLLYQQGACAITHAIENIRWRQYSIDQPGGSLPVGPIIILVHIASTHIPFTSESKEAIADVPEIISEIELALKELARKLLAYLSKQKALTKRREKEVIIYKLLPRIAAKTSEILELPVPDITPVVAKIMGNVHIKRQVEQSEKVQHVIIQIRNNTETKQKFALYESLPHPIYNPSPPPEIISTSSEYNYRWKLNLKPQEGRAILYDLTIPGEAIEKLPPVIIEGIDKELVTGTEVMVMP